MEDISELASITRTSEPYQASGGLAAVGVLNQLGRPDMEPAEVLVREALQNCWDAKDPGREGIEVKIGRTVLSGPRLQKARRFFAAPPAGLSLDRELESDTEILYFADYGTGGLGGPVRADQAGEPRDYIDFVLNIGQPPDKVFGGGSFGYGKAAFYLASRASTIIVDTLCRTATGTERRLIGCALGDNYTDRNGRPFTGRHWWGLTDEGSPAPLTGSDAEAWAAALGLPQRGPNDLGTTIAVLSPAIGSETSLVAGESAPGSSTRSGADQADNSSTTMRFLADAIVWNFWPRMVDTPDGQQASLRVSLTDNGRRIAIPNPRTHPRLRGFVDALDRLHSEPQDDSAGGLLIDRPIDHQQKRVRLGRLVIARGSLAPGPPDGVPLTRGARETRNGVHHVAVFRAPEIVVRYLPGDPPTHAGASYSGVFRCSLETDVVFKSSEPPTHDDWVPLTLSDPHKRSMVKVALDKIRRVCREAAGNSAVTSTGAPTDQLPLGELSDSIGRLMPRLSGSGSRLPSLNPPSQRGGGRGRSTTDGSSRNQVRRDRQGVSIEPGANPSLGLDADGEPLVLYPFKLRTAGQSALLSAIVEVMNRDGDKSENDPPAGTTPPDVHSWLDPAGEVHLGVRVVTDVEGAWTVRVRRSPTMMLRVDISAAPEGETAVPPVDSADVAKARVR